MDVEKKPIENIVFCLSKKIFSLGLTFRFVTYKNFEFGLVCLFGIGQRFNPLVSNAINLTENKTVFEGSFIYFLQQSSRREGVMTFKTVSFHPHPLLWVLNRVVPMRGF